MRVLVVGGYGFIGSECVRQVSAAGHDVVALGRSATKGQRLLPTIRWIAADMAALGDSEDWRGHLEGVEVVINAAGVLQRGAADSPDAVHNTAIVALIAACETAGVARFVQISAPGAGPTATTEFLRSKSHADARLRAGTLDFVVIRPGLVIGPNAYGGTAMIRTLASFPLIQPIVLADRLVQTVALADLAQVVLDAVEGRFPARSEFDLVEDDAHTLESLVGDFRTWLGFAPARMSVSVPVWVAQALARIGDALGYLGWRPPLRTTTLRVMAENVIGDPSAFRAVSQRKLSSLRQTLAGMASTLQERWFARLYLVLPAIVAVLSLFWMLSGVIGLRGIEHASALIVSTTITAPVARFLIVAGALLDIAVGIAVLVRRWARAACWAMAAITLGYLVGATLLRPDLWGDPLGPLLKAIPAAMLAVAAAILLEER